MAVTIIKGTIVSAPELGKLDITENGYLVAENGIFLLGIPLMTAGAVWFELTLLLDIFVAVFVMGIAINHISHTFESIDVGFHDLRD